MDYSNSEPTRLKKHATKVLDLYFYKVEGGAYMPIYEMLKIAIAF